MKTDKASRRYFRTYDLVVVDWLDSEGGGGWVQVEHSRTDVRPVRSVGWIIAETKEALTIAAHLGLETDGDETVFSHSDAMTIPVVAIRKRTVLRRRRRR